MFNSNFSSSINKKDLDAVKKKFYVKHMVCLRDQLVLKSVLDKQGVKCNISAHGAIECLEDITKDRIYELKMGLKNAGLILLDEVESMLIDRIINTIVEMVHYTDSLPKLDFIDVSSEHVVSDTGSVLKIFSDVKGMSILQFFVIQKIERAKELVLYEDMTPDEIAEVLNYKNKDEFIAQFKKITGLTPAYFKRMKEERTKIAGKYLNRSQSDSASTTGASSSSVNI